MTGEKSNLSIFETFKTKNELTGEATRQRAIITHLASEKNSASRTRTAISQSIAKKNGMLWKNIYSGIFKDFDEVLLPLGIVEEAGRLPLKRGPKALQEKGIPFYQLTTEGLLVTLAIREFSEKDVILDQFFLKLDKKENEFKEIIEKMVEIAPKFTYTIFETYVKAFCDGILDRLLPINSAKIKQSSGDVICVQKEILQGFMKLSKKDRDGILDLFERIS